MTIDARHTVLQLLQEDPTLRVYQYRHAQTDQVLYAVFPRGQYDDMAWAPNVREAVLLYDAGTWTAIGQVWHHDAREEDTPHA